MNASSLNFRLDGSGPRLVLLHPVGLDLTFFDALVAELAPACQILRVDLPGHGKSAALSDAPALKDYAEAVHELLQSIGFAPATIVGFSFGGMIAQVLALEFPRDVQALVPSACPSTLPEAGRKMMADRGTLALEQGMTAVVEATLQRWFTPAFRSVGGDDAARRRLLSNDANGWAQAWRAISQLDTKSRLRMLKIPTLCIAGEADTASPPDVVQVIAAEIRGAQFFAIPNAPHMLFIEQPEPVGQAIRNFLTQIPHDRKET